MIDTVSRAAPDAFTDYASVITPRLFRSALLLCGDWQLAEDLVQTTLAKLYVSWTKVHKADNPEAYAHGTLTKTFLSQRRVRRNSETPMAEVVERFTPGPDQDLRLDLFAALASLEAADRAVVVLRYWEDRSVTETARLLGMTDGAVRTRASRAMLKLRDALAPTKEAKP